MGIAQDTIKKALAEKNMTQSDVAKKLGEPFQKLSQQMTRVNDMKVERFVEVLNAIGYEVDVKPKAEQ